MHNVGIAVVDFQKEACGKLGKKGTASDYTIYNRKDQNSVLCFYEPSMYPEKLVSLLHCLNSADFALVVFDSISKELGEAIVAIDALGLGGVLCLRSGTKEELAPLIRGTTVEKFEIVEYEPSAILSKFEGMKVPRSETGQVRIPIDSSFNVKSVGVVSLGIIKSGKVSIHDELIVYPSGKKASVRSLQVQDKDVNEANAGDRVGLCLKNVDVPDLDRGVELAKEGEMLSASELSADAEVSKFQKSGIQDGVNLFVSFGMQFVAAKVSGNVAAGGKGTVKLTFVKPFAYKKGEVGLVCDTGRPLRIVGKVRF
jgi:selenocysteine-specific translation elongation factor